MQVVSTTGGTWTANYTYDSASRLNQANAGNLHTSYTYDGFNNRISQTNNVSGTTTNYLVDPSGSLPQLLGEFPSGSGPSIYYIPGLGQDVVPAGQNTGTLSYFNTDGLGSVRQMTNNTGNLTYAANFDPWGGILNANVLPGATNLGYTGAPTDPSGLVYLNARFYNPAIGSFQNHDPLEGDPSDPASFNAYSYTQGNPVSGVDPTGKCDSQYQSNFALCALQDVAIVSNAVNTGFGDVNNALNTGLQNAQTGAQMVNTVTDAIANHPAAALNLLNSGTTQVLNQSSQLFDTTFHQTWDGGLSSWWATEQKSDKDIGIWWNSGGSTQFIGIFFPEIYAINTLQEWGRGRQPQLSDALSFIPVAGYAGEAFDALGSLGQSESTIADVAANDAAEADSAAADASDNAAGATCSFSADTPVATDKGEQAISSLKVGDHVLAYDPETTKIALKAIDAVLKHIDLSLEDLTIDGEVIHTTPNHPFYTQDKGWVAADNLTIGESILKADGSYGKVQALKAIDHAQVMYNLTVHDDHDYFVGIGQWLVHNKCPTPSEVWLLDAKKRGTEAENIFGSYTGGDFTGNNFKAYDFWDPQTKTAISIKTIDLNSLGYQNVPGDINRNLSDGLKDIRNFLSDTLPDGTTLSNSDIVRREMWVFIPPSEGPVYERQLNVLMRFMSKAANQSPSVYVSLATLP